MYIIGFLVLLKLNRWQMLSPTWTEVAVFKKMSLGRTYDTFRIYVNEHGCVKGRSERQGTDCHFKDRESMRNKIKSLKKFKFSLRSGEIPKKVVSPV